MVVITNMLQGKLALYALSSKVECAKKRIAHWDRLAVRKTGRTQPFQLDRAVDKIAWSLTMLQGLTGIHVPFFIVAQVHTK